MKKLVILMLLFASCVSEKDKIEISTFKSDTLKIDKIYTSMVGPHTLKRDFYLSDTADKEILWIKSYKADVYRKSDDKKLSDAYICHANIFFHNVNKNDLFKTQSYSFNGTVLTPGVTEVVLPNGFGVPIESSTHHTVQLQALNLNEEKIDLETYQKAEIGFIRDRNTKLNMKPLFTKQLIAKKIVESEKTVNKSSMEEIRKTVGQGCLVGTPAGYVIENAPSLNEIVTGHWVLEKGKEVNRNFVTDELNLEKDTFIHAIVPHLHPFAESVSLIDATTGEVLYKAKAKNHKDKIGLTHVDYFSSAKGIPVFEDHKYEVQTIYNNTSSKQQEAMAILNVFLLDYKFKRK